MSSSANAARRFLKMNSLFSVLTAAPLLLAAGMVAPLLFAVPVDWAAMALRGLGIGLLGFAGLVYALSRYRFVSRAMVHEIVFLDVLWIIGSVVLIAAFGQVLTATGVAIVAAVALVVAFFAISQFLSAARIERPVPVARVEMRDGTLHAIVKRRVRAPVATVWDVMTDHPGYADVADNLSKVEVLSGDGLGMTRRCHGPKGESWTETCDLFEPGQAYGFRVHTEAADYPYPFADLSGRWRVEDHPEGAAFEIDITARLKGNALSRWLFATMAGPQFRTILIDLADAWAARMEREAGLQADNKAVAGE
ncbi:Polyketide cyclase / dehydrase and lipid transport [Roseivivax lentus]|uniref:Polyketide cyclase / dehydrase and lipid transport n=1 Tax=Roseivivax lentus TaxID=633194 RepID=A0A1N7NUP9_9RHOB|nr:SRPBCC family protein [Roseivivax lentus]SIT02031.1 Polyketide cyclase / dehydrase and lipid transport [Roseivivax lentus]